jgi:transposase-like protein
MPKMFDNEYKDQIVKEVKEVGNCTAVATKHGLNPKSVNRWVLNDKHSDKITDVKRVRELEKILKDRNLEIEVLKALLKKTYPHWSNAEQL